MNKRLEIVSKTGRTYTDRNTGESRQEYVHLGNLWLGDNGEPESIHLKVVPTNWDGRGYVREPRAKKIANQVDGNRGNQKPANAKPAFDDDLPF